MMAIPAGALRMGDKLPNQEGNLKYKVRLKSFFMGRYEVTNLQCKNFVDVTGHRQIKHWQNGISQDTGQHPVVNVSWQDACAHAE